MKMKELRASAFMATPTYVLGMAESARTTAAVPLVTEAFDWDHGVFAGAAWLGEALHGEDLAATALIVLAIAAALAPRR